MPEPRVTVIIPCRNESRFIAGALESLVDDYVFRHGEVLVVDGLSQDGTPEIVRSFIDRGYPLRLVENPHRLQVFGLNIGIEEARGEFIVRADAHALYPPGYIRRCVGLLEKTGAENVGGVMAPEGETNVQQAIALAMQHPLGVGDARFHLGDRSGEVDTVYLGAFRRDVFDRVGPFDTRCRTNEDAELNLRILKGGGRIYLDSGLKVRYFPRRSLKELAVQYFRYGQGRCYTTLKHRRLTSWRQVLPVLFVPGLIASLIIALWRPLFVLFPAAYLVVTLLTALLSWPRRKIPIAQRLVLGAAFPVMHLSWGTGFWHGLAFRRPERPGKGSRG